MLRLIQESNRLPGKTNYGDANVPRRYSALHTLVSSQQRRANLRDATLRARALVGRHRKTSDHRLSFCAAYGHFDHHVGSDEAVLDGQH